MQIVYSPKQAKAARIAAQISQSKVATDLGLNRSYLSLFESGKYVFDDATLRTLREYFQTHAQTVAETTDNQADIGRPDGPRLLDGFLIPPGADESTVDQLLDEYAQNKQHINALCMYDIRKHSFLYLDSSLVAEKTGEVIRLMARNFAIIETLHGHDTGQPWMNESRKARPSTTGDFLSQMFGDMLKSRHPHNR